MVRYYDKQELKESLELENSYQLLEDLGGEPEYSSIGIISQTICHNEPGEGSRKLYYYQNSKLFYCYTGCEEPSFDIFELIKRVVKIQKDLDWELYDCMAYVADYWGFQGSSSKDSESIGLKDWDILKRYDRNELFPIKDNKLKEYNPIILTRLSYPRIQSWEKEGITREVCKKNLIGYFPRTDQITIPHFDIEGKLIGIRGRYLAEEDANRYGKYRPLMINGELYNHPLSMNLYNLNRSKDNIKRAGAAIIFEGEKSSLLYQSYFGQENDISVACCGSSISAYQIQLLSDVGAKEIVIAFDRQFQKINDNEFKKLKANLLKIREKYKNYLKVSLIFDKKMITPYKASPVDCGKDIFLKLFKERIIL